MQLLSQIGWRIRFILFEMWGLHPKIIAYVLFPWVRNKTEYREQFLIERGYFTWDKNKKTVHIDGMTFSYPHKIPTANFISLILGNDQFIKKNFIDVSAFKIEGPYEHGNVQFEEGDVVFDIGANIGISTVHAARRVGPTGKVYAFEPIEEAREYLEKNLVLNNITNVEIVPYGLGAKKGSVDMQVDETDLGNSTAVRDMEHAKQVTVELTTVDDFVLQNNILKLDFIFADIEGMEREMLRGAKKTLRTLKPKLAICTYHLPDDPVVLESLIVNAESPYKINSTRAKLYARTSTSHARIV